MGSKEEQAERQAKLQSSGSGTKPNENANIAQKGAEQFQEGINQLTGHGSNKSS